MTDGVGDGTGDAAVELGDDYAEAWAEWRGGADEVEWDSVSGDGLADETR